MTGRHRLNDPESKRMLAVVRGGDYAHAGEEEAIELTWHHLPKNPRSPCLDAGCGLGGSAAFVQNRAWGQVTGVDVDAASIGRATQKYPEIRFASVDIVDAGARFPGEFENIYSLNAFYAFPDQSSALRSLHQAARESAALAIFDYADPGGFRESAFRRREEVQLWSPIHLASAEKMMASEGWQLVSVHDLSLEYERWYRTLISRFQAKRPELESQFRPALIDYATGFYADLAACLKEGNLSGAIFVAHRISV